MAGILGRTDWDLHCRRTDQDFDPRYSPDQDTVGQGTAGSDTAGQDTVVDTDSVPDIGDTERFLVETGHSLVGTERCPVEFADKYWGTDSAEPLLDYCCWC